MKFVMTYENVGNVMKDPVVKELTPSVLAGTPSIIMTIDAVNNNMKPGERRNYTVKVLLTKMRCPIRFEVRSYCLLSKLILLFMYKNLLLICPIKFEANCHIAI